jgi:hypothetical protein
MRPNIRSGWLSPAVFRTATSHLAAVHHPMILLSMILHFKNSASECQIAAAYFVTAGI